jgi:hypothetical protein
VTTSSLSIVIACEGASENLLSIIDALSAASDRNVDVTICSTNREDANLVPPEDAWSFHLSRGGSRIPHMWRDGILMAKGDWVATLTAHCVPNRDWLDRALNATNAEDEVAGIGGAILLPDNASRVTRAMHLLRYLAYTPETHGTKLEPAADNAVYRRRLILDEGSLLDAGFWEPEFHAKFRSRGFVTTYDATLQVQHLNRYTVREFCSQRIEHGSAFGRSRMRGKSRPKKLFYLLVSPLLPVLFFSKILGSAKRRGMLSRTWLTPIPWLMLYLSAWGMGEALGYWSSLHDTDESTD